MWACTPRRRFGGGSLDWISRHTGTNADNIADLNSGGTETVTAV